MSSAPATSDGATFDEALAELRTICRRLPEMSERLSHGSPSFFVREKKVVASLHDAGHHHEAVSLWAPAPPGVQAQLVDAEPDRFYVPPYVGHRGWIGLRLDLDVDWSEVDAIVTDAFRLVAPKKLVADLDRDG